MDAPLVDLAKSSGFQTTGDYEWPENVDKDVSDFVDSEDSRAIFVVEQSNGLMVGPPPRDKNRDERVLAVAKPEGAITERDDWEKHVVSASMPFNEPIQSLHTLLAQIVLPLFDVSHSSFTSSSNSLARSRLVDAERALAQLMQQSQVAFVDILSGSNAAKAQAALEAPSSDQTSLNTLQHIFNTWKQQFSQLAMSGEHRQVTSASAEVGFWVALEAALRHALQQMESPLFKDVWNRLEQGKRFQATHNFEGDTGLKATLAKTSNYTQVFFKDLQLGEILAASSISQLNLAVEQVMSHILRKLRPSNYPTQRCVAFVEAIGRDFSASLLKISESTLEKIIDLHNLSENVQFDTLEEQTASLLEIRNDLCSVAIEAGDNWDVHVRDFSTLVRELIRKRAEKFAVVRIKSSHHALISRLTALKALCTKHQELLPLIASSVDGNKKLISMFNQLVTTDKLLQLSDQKWQHLESEYSRVAHNAEVDIAEQLRAKLQNAASNESELLAVFNSHSVVLTRPQVRAVAHDFQTSLLNRARKDLVATGKRIHALVQAPSTEYDIVDRVLKMRQLKLRTQEIRKRLQTILGSDWQKHSEGALIDLECEKMNNQLDTEAEVKRWADEVHEHTQTDIKSTVFSVSPSGELAVNGLYSQSSSHTQLQTLKALGFRFDYETVQAAEQLSDTNSAVSRLVDAVSTLKASLSLLESFPRINTVSDIQEHTHRIMSYVRMGLRNVKFNYEELYQFVTGFEHAVNLLDMRVTQLVRSDAEVSQILDNSLTIPVEEMVKKINGVLTASSVGSLIAGANEYAESVRKSLKEVVSTNICTQLREWQPFPSEHRIEIKSQQVRIFPELSAALALWYGGVNNILKPAIDENILDIAMVENDYTDAVIRINAAWDNAQQHFNLWKQLQPLWDQRFDVIESEIASRIQESDDGLKGIEVQQWIQYLQELCDARNRLFAGVSDNTFLVLDTMDARKQVEDKYEKWVAQLSSRLAKCTATLSSDFMIQSKQLRRNLEQTNLNVSTLLNGIEIFTKAKNMLVVVTEHTVPLLVKSNSLLTSCGFDFSSYHQWYSTEALEMEFEALKQIYEHSNEELQRAKPQILAGLEQTTASRVIDSEQFKHKWQANRPLQAQIDPQLALQILAGLEKEMLDISTSINTVKESFMSLNVSLPASLTRTEKNISDWSEELKILKSAWSELAVYWGKFASLASIEFLKLPDDFHKQLQDLNDSIVNDVPDTTKQLQNYQRLLTHSQKIADKLPQLEYLRSSDAIMPHHLQKLVPQCSSKPLLKELWMQLPDMDLVKEVVEQAEGEHQLLRYIDAQEEKWKAMILIGTNLSSSKSAGEKKPVFALQNLDEVLTLANDNLAAFQGMRASAYFQAVAPIVQEWESKLGLVRKLFDKFVDAQQKYLYLRGVLTSPSVSAVLPAEARRFKNVADEFLQLYNSAVGKPALEFTGSNQRLDGNLTRLINQFASLHRSLSGFMETQRRRFPRLYFIGDDELLEIVGNPLSVWGFKHLPSLFQGVHQLVPTKDRTTKDDYTVISPDGEEINVKLPPNYSDNVEMLVHLEKELKSALKALSSSAITELEQCWPDPQNFGLWLERYPLQVALLALRERWSRTKDTSSHQQILQWLSSSGDDTSLWMRRREVLVAELTHQLETPISPLLVNVERLDSGDIMVKCGPCEMPYGFDFITMEPVVRTKVTDELFLSAASSIAQNKGGSVIGPAGTGKTETVKALGSVFGRTVVVFNCDDEFDVNSVQRIMNGCSATQSWACFDEFNRLSRKVLSSVAHTVSVSVKKSPVFVTMNPGYSGRTVLPPNMRYEFREFVLNAPDAQKISRVLLYAHGRVNTTIADSVVGLLQGMSKGASKQKHYDWGLRALKGILQVCRKLNGNMRLACEIAIRPRLLSQDLELFDNEINKIPVSNSVEDSTNSLLHSSTDYSNLDIDEKLLTYVKSLHIFIHLFAGVMLLGPAGSGKSSIWQALAHHLNAEVIVIDPSAVSKSVLLGKQDPLTREWSDGLLSRLLRRILNNLRGEKHKEWFVVLSGEVEPNWAEALNSVLDDNRQLTLSSGEILNFPPNVHIIFETTDLHAATPATVSRLGMICVHSTDYISNSKVISPELMRTAHDIKHAMTFLPLQAENTFKTLELGSPYLSLAWALSGDSDYNGRMKISDAIRKQATKEGVQLPEGNLLECYVSDLTGQWHYWRDSVDVVQLDRVDILRPDVVVPTADTAAHEALLQQALSSHRPLLLVGPPGSGKTMTLFNALRQLSQMELISLNFSSTATPQLVIQALEMYCEYTTTTDGSRVLSPSGSRWAALFIDEINLPQPNEYDVVPVIQFLHFLIEHGGFYDSNGRYVKVERVQLVGACNPPPQRRPLPDSLLRRFMVVNVDYPSDQSLQTIYSTFMSTFEAQHLVPSMLKVYRHLEQLEPDEIWTPRELTRWMRSIYTAYNATMESQHTPKLLNELFVYEGCRVLGDRLATDKQVEVLRILSETCETSSSIAEDSVIWSYYISKRPKFVGLDTLRDFLTARLPVFVEEVAGEGDRSLVMHDDFIKLLSRVDRILRQPQGHGLIVGPASVGKTTAIRFSCWAAGLDIRMLRIHSEYGDDEFANDLRNVLLSALRRPVCLVLSEDLLQAPEFVERMNSLLANGEVPGLFGPEHVSELEDSCRRAGFIPFSKNNIDVSDGSLKRGGVSNDNEAALLSQDDQGDINSWFRQKVVSNLHVMFTATSTERASPALLNRCTVIRVSHWSMSTRRQIATQWCSTTDVNAEMVKTLTELPCGGGREFIELCYQFTSVYNKRKQSLEDTQRHFVSGGDRLKDALIEIIHLKRHLASQQQRLESEDARSSAVLQQMLTEQSEAEQKRVAAVEIRAAVQQQNTQILERKKAANDDLAAAEPLIEQAAQGVQNIKKAQLNELRSLTNPPEPVKITLEAVCMLLGLKTDGSWRQVLGAVRGDEFIPRIVNFDTSRLQQAPIARLISRIEKEYMTLPSFTYERVDRASKAGGPLFRWVVAQVAYARALSAVKPLMEEIELLNQKSIESQAQLSAIETMLKDLEVAINKSKLEYSKAVAQCEVLKADMHKVTSQLERAESLLASLDAEQKRWKHGSEKFPEEMAQLPGNTLVESVQLALSGPLDISEQENLLADMHRIGVANGIAVPDLRVIQQEHIVVKSQIAQESRSISLVIDPNSTWEKETINGDRDVKVVSFLMESDSLLKELDTALRFGQHLVIKNAERFNPLLVPLLNREYFRKGSRLLVNLGSGDIDVAAGFRLTLHSRDLLSVESNRPLLLSRVSVVNFRMTAGVFEKMIGDALLKADNPELAAKRYELQHISEVTEKKLRNLEKELLTALSDSAGTLLENQQLVHSLEVLKSESVQLKQVQESTSQTLLDLDSAYNNYAPIAKESAGVYVFAQSYAQRNPFYRIGVDWLWQIAESLVQANCPTSEFTAKFTQAVNDRIATVVSSSDAPANSHRLSLESVIRESNSHTPIIAGLTTTNAMDPTAELVSIGSNVQAIAMGSKQAAVRSLQLIDEAMEMGDWVVIQNTEIADEDWLRKLSRKLQAVQQSNTGFRLILTGLQSELVSIPDLVASGRPVSIERVRGIKANMQYNAPEAETKDVFVLNWIHSSFTEAFPECNFSKDDFDSACWLFNALHNKIDKKQLELALLVTVWAAKCGSAKDRTEMEKFTISSFEDADLPTSNFAKWIASLPDNKSWLPKGLVSST